MRVFLSTSFLTNSFLSSLLGKSHSNAPKHCNSMIDSDFRYPEVMEVEIDFLYGYRNDAIITAALPIWIDRATAGELPHCSKALLSLYTKLNSPNSPPQLLPEPCNREVWGYVAPCGGICEVTNVQKRCTHCMSIKDVPYTVKA